MVDQLVADRKQALAAASKLEPLQAQLQQAQHLLEPEACPSAVQLQLAETTASALQMPASTSQTTHKPGIAALPSHATAVATAATKPIVAGTGPTSSQTSTAVSGVASTTPSSARTLSSTTDGTVASTSGGDSAVPQGVCMGLGWDGSVPRYLRWNSPVALQPYSLPAVFSRLQDIWAAKAVFDAQHQAQQPLLGFLWTYFRAEHGQQAVVAQDGYSFLFALRQHQHQLATASMFLRILEGQWQEAMWHDCRHMLEGVAHVLETLSKCL